MVFILSAPIIIDDYNLFWKESFEKEEEELKELIGDFIVKILQTAEPNL